MWGVVVLTYYGGDIHLEVIRASDVFVANSRSEDSIQTQDWVILQQRVTVEKAKRMAEKGVDITLITKDNEYDSGTKLEQDGTDLCTLLHRFFRIDGEVYYERAVKGTVITKPRSLAPDIKRIKETELYKRIAQEIDAEYGVDEKMLKHTEEKPVTKASASLYPFTYFTWYEQEDNFYGRSEVDTLISDQKAINVSYGIMLLGAQHEATGKTVVRKGALGPAQQITNDPTQVLFDYTPSGNGYYKLTPTQLNTASVTLVDMLIKYVRTTKGVSEVSTGEAYGANASGAAIAQLQSQANSSSELIRDHIWECLEEFGEVLLQMWRLYYTEGTAKEFTYLKEEEGMAQPKLMHETFDGSKIGQDFEVTVKAVKGTNSSIAGDIQILESALSVGQIDFVDLIETYPDSAISDKKKYLRVIKDREKRESVQLAQKLQQVTMVLEQLQKQSSEKDKYIEKLLDVVKSTNTIRDNAAKIIKRDEDLKNEIVEQGAKRVGLEKTLELENEANANLQRALYSASSDVARLQNERQLEDNLAKAQGIQQRPVQKQQKFQLQNTQE